MAWVKLFRRQAGGNLGKVYQPGSVLSLAPTKGLFNEPGQNSCFLNSAVQVLWQLDIFRRSLRGLTGHVCLGDACIFCALKSIFAQFQTSREKVLPSDAMRHALAESFKDEHRFQLGLMDDAAECFENILQRIHFHIVPNSEGDMCTSKSCITHQKFAMTLYEQCVCRSCGASSDPLPFTEFVRYISTTALCNEVDKMLERHERLKPEMFADLLQAANTTDDYRKCPSNCGQKIKIRRVLMNCPEIVTIGLVWDSDNSDLTEDVVRNLATQLYLPGLFFMVTDEQAKESRLYLVGMICYTSKHYCAFAYHTKSAKWFLFDDASVKEVGTKWKDVVTKCIRCHYQPLLLFYANPDGTAVTNEDALRQVQHWSHCKREFHSEETGSEKTSSVPKKPDYTRDQFGEHIYQNNGYKLHVDEPTFTRGIVQSSAGRGPVKLNRDEQQEKLRDVSRECAQKANLKSLSSSQRKVTEKTQKKEITRPKGNLESSGGVAYNSKPSTVVHLKSESSPTVNGFRKYPDPHFYSSQGRGPYKQERSMNQSRQSSSFNAGHATIPESKQVARAKNNFSAGYDTDSSQEYREKPNPRSKKAWRPMRETLNVDSIFNDNEKSQHGPRNLVDSNGKQSAKNHIFTPPSKESPKRNTLMTIFEDEVKQESGSRSSLESLGKSLTERNKVTPDMKMYYLDNWQRTESGYESSDHISSGSSNLDSPIIEGTGFADGKGLQDTSLCSDQQQSTIALSTSPQIRSNLHGINNEHHGLAHCKSEDKLSVVPQEPAHSPSGLRRQFVELRRDPRSPNLLPASHDVKSDDRMESSSWLNSCSLDSCHLHHENIHSLRETSVGPTKMLNNGLCSQRQHPSATGSLAKISSQPASHSNRLLPRFFVFGEDQSCSRDEHCSVDHPEVPPPLPPKKYIRNAAQRTEQNFALPINSKLSETLARAYPAIFERHLSGDFIRPEPDSGYYPKEESCHGTEIQSPYDCQPKMNLHTMSRDVSANINDPIAPTTYFSVENHGTDIQSPYDCQPKMNLHTISRDVSASINDPIAPTTYFSVDNCMTDTYRMKYHHRPRLNMGDRSGYQREPGHLQLTDKLMEPAYHRTLQNAHTSLTSRTKQTLGGIPCNR
ncbi:inactive ubiquitin carboxyl-terminal hydrolase 53 isoform X1 [Xenopus laevis]|uniref:Inactive ubiquitin carboxyl-terminal hydrolase 53 isoform X1 n=1 Tax=Xenopus laevis TaxID=8355 RepID=A0A8J0U0G1_XENLA|nr:inactive ubiquitin carboxyl-terminal hydrolase 53 isoform X1 [Xenopus laevis]